MQFTRRCQEVSGTYARYIQVIYLNSKEDLDEINIDTEIIEFFVFIFVQGSKKGFISSSRSSDTIGCLHIKRSFLKQPRDSFFFFFFWTTCLASSSNEDIFKGSFRTFPFSLEKMIFKMIEFDLRDPDQASPSGQPSG